MKLNRHETGFTLIELLVVIAIIGLLSTLAVVSLNNARQKSRDAKRVADIKQTQTALELYYADKNGYPIGTAVALGAAATDVLCDTAAGFQADATGCGTTYMGQVPKNPTPVYSVATTDYLYSSLAADGATACAAAPCPEYKINFGLEGAVGALTVGSHDARPAGIQ